MDDQRLGAIFRLATGFWESGVLFAMVELDLFERLKHASKSASILAQEAGLDPEGMVVLLEAAASLRLLDRSGETYGVSELSRRFFLGESPQNLSSAIRIQQHSFSAWANLADRLRGKGPAPASPDALPQFVRGMHERALSIARAVAEIPDLRGTRQLMDVGAGPCTYSMLLLQRTPGLRAIALDSEPVLRVAQEIHAGANGFNRLHFQAFDVTQDPFPRDCDAALLSGILHRFDENRISGILGRLHEALQAPGRLIVSDVFIPDEEGAFPRLFALHMYLLSPGSRGHRVARIAELMEQAGFALEDRIALPPPVPHTVLLASKSQAIRAPQ